LDCDRRALGRVLSKRKRGNLKELKKRFVEKSCREKRDAGLILEKGGRKKLGVAREEFEGGSKITLSHRGRLRPEFNLNTV